MLLAVAANDEHDDDDNKETNKEEERKREKEKEGKRERGKERKRMRKRDENIIFEKPAKMHSKTFFLIIQSNIEQSFSLSMLIITQKNQLIDET